MAITLPYPQGNHLKIYAAQYYPANSDTTVGGNIGPEIPAGNAFTALKSVTLDPIQNTSTHQHVKLYIKNTSSVPVFNPHAYIVPSLGTWGIGVETQKNVTNTSYTIGSSFPTNILVDGSFKNATSLGNAIKLCDYLDAGEFIAVWVEAYITFSDLFRSASTQVTCPLIVAYAVASSERKLA